MQEKSFQVFKWGSLEGGGRKMNEMHEKYFIWEMKMMTLESRQEEQQSQMGIYWVLNWPLLFFFFFINKFEWTPISE